MDQIILDKDYPCDLVRVLACLCRNIQQEYDISPQLLNHIINLKQLTTWFRFLYDQTHAEMTWYLNEFKTSFVPDETQISRDEYDKCGYLVTSHHNTYVAYCNAHRYLHPHPILPDHSDRFEIKHPFVTKNYNQIIEERYKLTIHQIYQRFVNKLYHMIRYLFTYIIETNFKSLNIPVNSQEINTVISQMKNDPTIFKSRCVYEYFDASGDDALDEHHREPKKIYYIKVYHQ